MGLGDFLLAAGQARKLGRPVRIGDGVKETAHPLRNHIPYLNGREWFIDYVGHRGYIKRVVRDPEKRVIFNMDYRAHPADIQVEAIPNGCVIIEPSIKPGAPPGKLWRHYQEVVDAFPHETFIQFNQSTLRGVESVKTNPLEAAQYMKGAKCYIGAEGFLHHVAAGVGTDAVVVIGAYSPPQVVGYDFHTNIAIDVQDELGSRIRSGAMERITPEEVISGLRNYCG